MKAALFGADSSNLAPPMVVDGSVVVSQAPAASMYLGHKFGLITGIKATAVALQYALDISDLHEMMRAEFNAGIDRGNLSTVPKFMAERFAAVVGSLERSIQGPFF